jgi:hypothetical protein
MAIKLIDPDKAPTPPAHKGAGKAQAFIELIESLPADKVAEITPEDGQTVRGIKVSIGRIASARKIEIQSWDSEGKVYLKKL